MAGMVDQGGAGLHRGEDVRAGRGQLQRLHGVQDGGDIPGHRREGGPGLRGRLPRGEGPGGWSLPGRQRRRSGDAARVAAPGRGKAPRQAHVRAVATHHALLLPLGLHQVLRSPQSRRPRPLLPRSPRCPPLHTKFDAAPIAFGGIPRGSPHLALLTGGGIPLSGSSLLRPPQGSFSDEWARVGPAARAWALLRNPTSTPISPSSSTSSLPSFGCRLHLLCCVALLCDKNNSSSRGEAVDRDQGSSCRLHVSLKWD